MASGQRGWKRQPLGGSNRAGRLAGKALAHAHVSDARKAADQVSGVGMLRSVKQCLCRTLLRQPACIHDREPIADRGVHRHVVRHEDYRGAHTFLHFLDQAEDILLDDHVERGRRLVGDDEFRFANGRQGDRYPLSHAAGKLMRKRFEHMRCEAKPLQMTFYAGAESLRSRRRCLDAKSLNECFTRRTGLSTFMDPCMM